MANDYNCQNQGGLRLHVVQCLESLLSLHAPLPFQLTADLQTLNSYLRDGIRAEQLVQGLAQELAFKAKKSKSSDESADANHSMTSLVSNGDKGLKHYHSCALQCPQFKLNLDAIPTIKKEGESAGLRRDLKPEAPASHRSTRELKGGRQKVGKGNRTKLNKYLHEANKENCSMDLNCQKIMDDEKSLACIKSESQLALYNLTSAGIRKHSADLPAKNTKIESLSRGKTRYDSTDNRATLGGGGLKIKLKPKVVGEVSKMAGGVSGLLQMMEEHEKDITSFEGEFLMGMAEE